MDFLFLPVAEDTITWFETFLNDWIFVIALAFLAFELIRYTVLKKMSWQLMGDTITNFITMAMFIGLTYLLLGAFYLSVYFYAAQFALFPIEINWATILICVLLADLAYYWEHRFVHRVNLAWATHTVHHSSPFFNISVAYRFGPMDGIWPIFFHIPLVLVGFNPLVVFFSEIVVQLYQTLLHTETVKKFPKPVEAIMNTPSHHRVHHGSNPEYLDKNYAGIFITWDRMFGTFAEEKAPVTYGLVKPINSVNPINVFFHGLYRLGKNVATAKGFGNKIAYLFAPPEWQPKNSGKQEN